MKKLKDALELLRLAELEIEDAGETLIVATLSTPVELLEERIRSSDART